MKTKHVLALSMTLTLMITGTMAWAQGRGHDNGRRGNGKHNGHQGQKHDRHDHDRNHRPDYSYHEHDRHHRHEQPRTVYVYHPRPVERTVVIHHHHDRPARVRYVYYRDYDVYYDCDRKVYISFGGRNWSISTEIPVRMYYADRNTMASVDVDYYNDDFTHYLDEHRPGGVVCDHW